MKKNILSGSTAGTPHPHSEEATFLSRLTAGDKEAFARLYDLYAPALLALICRIVGDSTKATTVLETVFRQAHQRMATYKPNSQPMFVWLVTLARRAALDAVSTARKPAFQQLQLSPTGVVRANQPVADAPGVMATPTTESRLSELLQRVLYKNCTPEEAARSLGMPVDTARQQLRLAMQQLRAQQV